MADSNIGALPLAPGMADDSLLVMEQQGAAMKVTGAMLKGYAKQGVELEFQDALEAAQAAADRAEDAVSAVTDMTVSAHASDTATVSKSMREGRVNLDFGLPRGERGAPGPAGQTGPRGPQGAPGNGLTILGHYDTEVTLRAAVTAPEVGDAYSVGAEVPYGTYIFDGVALDWRNYGPLSGGGSGVIPEDVVTSEGGASLEIPAVFGDAPHVITITDEEEPPLTAEDVTYGDGTVKEALDDLKASVGDGKALVASAITGKGIPTEQDATFAQMAENIGDISAGSDTSDATAAPGDILGGKTAYTASGKVEGIIPSLPAQTITPGTADKTIANGQYLAGTQTVKGDPNLTSGNIKKGVSLFGVAGALESSFAAVLTVSADIGAVVTATCGDTSVEALSTTGTVVLELPIEGTWKVTAVRGVAQYNTVTLEVSNQYSAALTAAVHVQYLMALTPLSMERSRLAASAVGDYAIFCGGQGDYGNGSSVGEDNYSKAMDAYNKDLTRTSGRMSVDIYDGSAASAGYWAFFFGSRRYSSCIAYTASLTGSSLIDIYMTNADSARVGSAAASIGGYALLGGGGNTAYVHAYSGNDATRSALTSLVSAMSYLAAASNEKYAVFGGDACVNAYDESLVRTIAAPLGVPRSYLAAARAGNYVLFAGGQIGETTGYGDDTVEAYDLFLTRTTCESLSSERAALSGTTVQNFAIFGGGKRRNSGTTGGQNVADVYDPYLVHTVPTHFSQGRGYLAATSIGSYALFGGGEDYYSNSFKFVDTVDAYQYT